AGVLLLLDEQLLAGRKPVLLRDDLRGVHTSYDTTRAADPSHDAGCWSVEESLRSGCPAEILAPAMSGDNVERIKAGFDAHNRGDLDALGDVYDPDAVFETLLLGTHHGNESIRVI